MNIKVEIRNEKRRLYFNFSDIKKRLHGKMNLFSYPMKARSIGSDCWKSKIFGQMEIKYTKNIDALYFL